MNEINPIRISFKNHCIHKTILAGNEKMRVQALVYRLFTTSTTLSTLPMDAIEKVGYELGMNNEPIAYTISTDGVKKEYTGVNLDAPAKEIIREILGRSEPLRPIALSSAPASLSAINLLPATVPCLGQKAFLPGIVVHMNRMKAERVAQENKKVSNLMRCRLLGSRNNCFKYIRKKPAALQHLFKAPEKAPVKAESYLERMRLTAGPLGKRRNKTPNFDLS